MQDDRTDLMVFIDLGFVLLVGFLILTETVPRNNVALPGDAEDASETRWSVYNLHFDGEGRFWIEDGTQTFCDLNAPEPLQACMRQIVQTRSDAVFVLIPAGRATVQHLVTLLDVCEYHDWTCTVNN